MIQLDLEKNLRDSFEFGRRTTEDAGRLILLIILAVIPIVNLVVMGYATRVMKLSARSKEPPPLTIPKDLAELWIQGLKVAIAALIYMIIPMSFIGFGVFSFMNFGPWMMSPGVRPFMSFQGIVMTVLGLILAFMVAIIMAMAIVHMVRKDNFGKAFAIGEILKIVNKIGMGSYLVWVLAIFLVAVLVGAISSIPFIGWLVALIISPLYAIFVSRSATLTYLEGA